MLKLSYAIRDFNQLISQDYVYLDRTDRIAVMEAVGNELLFLRPRRFGKSLWLSTLMNYYDIAKADEFERLFGHLAIGQKPTSLHNQYLVMKWDFSMISSHGSIDQIEKSLHNFINVWITAFAEDYRDLLPAGIQTYPDAFTSFVSAVAAINRSPYKLYLFIDEYDNFANEVMMGSQGQNQKRYTDLVSGEGMFKTLFKNIKALVSGQGLERVFMTGVSPIVMNDVTSGANVNEDVTWLPYFSDLCGFSETEVLFLIEQIVAEGQLSQTKVEETLDQMRIFYNGSRFITHLPGGNVADASKVYNPILVLYFLRNIQRFGEYPENMLDSNLAPDYNKLVYISSHAKGEQLIHDALNEEAMVTVSNMSERFGVKEMLNPDKQREYLAILLCFLGALTVGGKTAEAEMMLEIPNLVMQNLYAERMLNLTFRTADERDQGHEAARLFFSKGDIEPICAFVEKHLLSVYDNRDYKGFNELTLKTLFIALLHDNNLYIMDSEPALQRQYGDLVMILRSEMRHYHVFDLLIEFKYVPLKKLKVGKYTLTGREVQTKSREALLKFRAVEEAFSAAQIQLRSYRQTLEQKYGKTLKLRTYTVMAVSYERLLWTEVR